MPRKQRTHPDDDDLTSQYSVRTMPVLPNRRTDQMRESRCLRAAQRNGIRLLRHANGDAFILITSDGITLDLTLEELEQRLLGRTYD